MNQGTRVAVLLLGVHAIPACTYHYRPSLPQISEREDKTFSPEEALEALDNVEWYLNAYGYASFSTPLIVQPDDAFKFNLSKVNSDTFFDAEKNEVSGRSAGLFQSARSSGFGLGVSADPIALQQFLSANASALRDQTIVASKQQIHAGAEREFQ
jgi:hypothetical protein